MNNIPWEDRPTSNTDVVWRYSQNPVIPRDLIPSSNSIFNSAVVPFQDGYAGVFRCDNKKREMNIHRGLSADGLNWILISPGKSFIVVRPIYFPPKPFTSVSAMCPMWPSPARLCMTSRPGGWPSITAGLTLSPPWPSPIWMNWLTSSRPTPSCSLTKPATCSPEAV